MSLPAVFRREAQDEMDEAYAWYEQHSPGLGEEFLTAVLRVVERIRENPTLYAPVHGDIRRGVTRRFPYGIYYRARPDRVEVLAVYHGRRDPRGWQERS